MAKNEVLFITPSLCQGGLEQSLIQTMSILDKDKYNIFLFTYRDDLSLLPLVPDYVKHSNYILNACYNHKLKAIMYLWLSKFFGKIKQKKTEQKYLGKRQEYICGQQRQHANYFYNNKKFDVVIGNSIGMTSEMAAVVNAKKRYVFFRSSVDLHHEMNVELFPKYDGIIAVSKGVKDMLCKSYDDVEDKVIVLENYVDAEQIIAKANEQFEEIDDKLKDRLVISTCGRFSQEKGFDLAVECAHILKDKGYDFLWYFIGDGAQREVLEQLIERYDLISNIRITGYTENPFPYIKCCDVYVQPSYHESYGRTIKEAIILGKPIVSTDTVGGHTLLDNNNYGEIVDVSPKAIADGIITVSQKKKQNVYAQYDIRLNQEEKETYVRAIEKILDS